MTLQRMKTAVVLLLGFLLAWQSVATVAAKAGPIAGAAKSSCCCTGCDFKHCATPACCAKPADNPSPFAPAPVPPRSSQEWQALAASVTILLTLPLREADEPSAASSSFIWIPAVPIFQRDCSYLI
jgi:hypothetical protein